MRVAANGGKVMLTGVLGAAMALFWAGTASAADTAADGTWTGAAGDGLWSTAGNWQDGVLPGTGKMAMLYVATNTVINVDVPGVTLKTLTFAEDAKVVLTGEKLSFVSGGVIRLPNLSDAVRPEIHNDLSFAGDFSFDGLTNTSTDRAGSRGLFYGTITSPGKLTVLFGGTVRLYGPVHIGGQTGAYATGAAGILCYHAPGNTVTNSVPTYSYPYLSVKNAMTESFVFNWNSSYESDNTGRYTIESCDQVCDHIGTGKSWTLGCKIYTPGAATIFQHATSSVLTPALLDGPLSVVWDPVNASHVQTFSNRTQTTTGRLVVSNGTMRVEAGSSFKKLTGIEVAPGARFEVATEVENAFAGVTSAEVSGTFAVEARAQTPFTAAGCTFNLHGDGRLALETALSLPRLRLNGVYLTNGVYTAENASFVTGPGSVTVTDGESFTAWNAAADGVWSATAMWTKGTPVSTALPAYITAEGADYAVALDTNTVAIGTLTLGNDAEHASRLVVSDDAAFVNGTIVNVDRGGVFEQTAGCSCLTNLSTPSVVRAGGVWRVTGSGTNDFYASGNVFTVQAGGLLQIAGNGRVRFRHQTSYYSHMALYGNLEISDYGYLGVVGQNGEPAQFPGPCRITLRDHGTLNVSRNLFSPEAGKENVLDAYGDSTFTCANSFMSARYSENTRTRVTLHACHPS